MSEKEFRIVSEFSPKGDQIKAIDDLSEGIAEGKCFQTLLGVTGSGKTFTVANVISKVQKPTLILTHNKTLAAQLYNEFKTFFPDNAVEYFVSYYDYYQPEAYVPHKDLYISKDASINEKIDIMRLHATTSLLTRKDVIVVSSVSCIYGLGSPDSYREFIYYLKVGDKFKRKDMISRLVHMQYSRNDMALSRGTFRVKGDVFDIYLPYDDFIIRVDAFAERIQRIFRIDPVSGDVVDELDDFVIYPSKHFITSDDKFEDAICSIEKELDEQIGALESDGKIVEAQRLKQRTLYDLEIMKESGYCSGIENYSRHFDKRKAGEPPYTLIDFFPDNFLIVIDESHVTVPQLNGMYHGDKVRKENLIDYGFRLPSALDNRPLKFSEFEKRIKDVVFMSATPADYEFKVSNNVVEQIVRPTGLVDPVVEIRPIKGQVADLLKEIKLQIKNGFRILVTTLTKKMSEELTDYLSEKGIAVQYLHSGVDTLERVEIIRKLRLKEYDVLVGVNLLREGLDIPEVSLVAIMDADKEGFLRDKRSLIQTIGRASRNSEGRVILYADVITKSIKGALSETDRRRDMQIAYNKKHNIVPKTIVKVIAERIVEEEKAEDMSKIPMKDVSPLIEMLEYDMNLASEQLEFEKAIELRDKIRLLKDRIGKTSK